MDNVIYVIGIGEDGAGGLTTQSLRIIEECGVLCGGERQLSFFPASQEKPSLCRAGWSGSSKDWTEYTGSVRR